MNKIEPDLKTVTFSTMSGDLIVNRKDDLYEMDFPTYELREIPVTDDMEKAFVPDDEKYVVNFIFFVEIFYLKDNNSCKRSGEYD